MLFGADMAKIHDFIFFLLLLQVIAIVTDSLTDLDIFRDLQEACIQSHVPVYILLDQTSLPAFLQMCKNLNVRLDDLQVYLLAFTAYLVSCILFIRNSNEVIWLYFAQ